MTKYRNDSIFQLLKLPLDSIQDCLNKLVHCAAKVKLEAELALLYPAFETLEAKRKRIQDFNALLLFILEEELLIDLLIHYVIEQQIQKAELYEALDKEQTKFLFLVRDNLDYLEHLSQQDIAKLNLLLAEWEQQLMAWKMVLEVIDQNLNRLIHEKENLDLTIDAEHKKLLAYMEGVCLEEALFEDIEVELAFSDEDKQAITLSIRNESAERKRLAESVVEGVRRRDFGRVEAALSKAMDFYLLDARKQLDRFNQSPTNRQGIDLLAGGINSPLVSQIYANLRRNNHFSRISGGARQLAQQNRNLAAVNSELQRLMSKRNILANNIENGFSFTDYLKVVENFSNRSLSSTDRQQCQQLLQPQKFSPYSGTFRNVNAEAFFGRCNAGGSVHVPDITPTTTKLQLNALFFRPKNDKCFQSPTTPDDKPKLKV